MQAFNAFGEPAESSSAATFPMEVRGELTKEHLVRASRVFGHSNLRWAIWLRAVAWPSLILLWWLPMWLPPRYGAAALLVTILLTGTYFGILFGRWMISRSFSTAFRNRPTELITWRIDADFLELHKQMPLVTGSERFAWAAFDRAIFDDQLCLLLRGGSPEIIIPRNAFRVDQWESLRRVVDSNVGAHP